jgi:hypothetical protein
MNSELLSEFRKAFEDRIRLQSASKVTAAEVELVRQNLHNLQVQSKSKILLVIYGFTLERKFTEITTTKSCESTAAEKSSSVTSCKRIKTVEQIPNSAAIPY